MSVGAGECRYLRALAAPPVVAPPTDLSGEEVEFLNQRGLGTLARSQLASDVRLLDYEIMGIKDDLDKLRTEQARVETERAKILANFARMKEEDK